MTRGAPLQPGSPAAAGPPWRVLFLATVLDRMGGAEKNLLDVVTGLPRTRFLPEVAVLQGGGLCRELVRRGVSTRGLDVYGLTGPRAVRQAFALAREVRRRRIRALVTYHHDADILGGVVGRLAGVPVVASRRDMGYQLERKHHLFFRVFSRRLYSRIVTVSGAVRDVVARDFRYPAGRIRVIHNGLRPGDYQVDERVRRAVREELGLDPRRPVVGMVGSFRPVKGQEHLVRASLALMETGHEFQVVVAGYKDTAYFERIAAMVEATPHGRWFCFPGSRADVPAVLSCFDVFVLSSLHEGFSNALIEAMAAGLPVVAADSGGNPEAVEHGRTGLLFPPADTAALQAHLQTLLTDSSLRKRMGHASREAVRRRFTLERMLRDNEALLLEVLADAAAGSAA